MPKVSIIVPVYNTEKYLEKCLESLVNQTLKDIEIIVVNDGSIDESQNIIEKYNKLYPDIIKMYVKPNTGISDTRNYGLSKAKSDYIGFLDSDDYVETTMFEKLYNKAISGQYDVVLCSTELFYENSDKKIGLDLNIDKDCNDEHEIKKSITYFYPVLWDKIIKRELIYNSANTFIEFQKNVWYEDLQWLLKLYPKIKSIGVINEVLHHYLQRGNSITFTYNEKLYDFINNMDGVISYYKENGIYDEYKDELEYLYARYSFATFPKRLAKCKDIKIYNEGIKYAISKVNENFPNYRENKYLKNSLKGNYIKYFNKFIAKITYLIESRKKHN